MKIIEEEILVPAKKEKITKYQSNDGKIFDNYNECDNYEREIIREKLFGDFKNRIAKNSIFINTPYIYSINEANAIYLKTKKEAMELYCSFYDRHLLTNTFEDFFDGEGWYIVAKFLENSNYKGETMYYMFSVKSKKQIDKNFLSQFDNMEE